MNYLRSPSTHTLELVQPDLMAAPAERRTLIHAIDATIDLRDEVRVLDAVSIEVRAAEMIAIVGPSGSGKSTMLETLAGLRTPTSGSVAVSGHAAPVGYVPQDDIVHRELSVESTVRYAARLRLPAGTPRSEVDATVSRVLQVLGLTDRRHLAVGSLSGGQRKRASIATELVVQPTICFLDEPTAGLDPIAGADLMRALRVLADAGTAIVMSTHNLTDVSVADRLVVMANGGRIVYDGSPAGGAAYIDGTSTGPPPSTVSEREPHDARPPTPGGAPRRRTPRRSAVDQIVVLTQRNAELATRNRMNLAIMAGSPLLVVAMLAVLFPPDVFDAGDRTTAIGLVYWLAFGGFFFGLTFGLLQVCTEFPIVRRERLVTIDVGPYLLAKAAVLVPILGVVNAVMIATLTWLGRLPSLDLRDAFTVWALLGLDSLAGLALGLLASSAVASPAQAALALPMLCFPAVLFSGAVLPVRSMTGVGRGIAAVTSDRWAFEAIARALRVAGAAGSAAHAMHGSAFTGPLTAHVMVLLVFVAVFGLAARAVLHLRFR